MKFTSHILGFVSCLAIGLGGFIAIKSSGPGGVEAATEDAAETRNSDTDAPAPAPRNGAQQPIDIGNTNKDSKEFDTATPVSVLEIKKGALSPTLTLYGAVESPRRSELRSAVSADVTSVEVFEGSVVSRGSVLVKLDVSDLSLIVAQRRAEQDEIDASIVSEKRTYQANVEALATEKELVQLSQRELARAEQLASTKVGTESAHDAALAKLRQLELSLTSRRRAIDQHDSTMAMLSARRAKSAAALQHATSNVGRTMVTAPFDGRVVSVSVSPGDRVRTGDTILTMYDKTFVEARAQLPSRYVDTVEQSIRTGKSMFVEAIADGKTYALIIDRLGGRVQPGSGSLDALFRFTGSDPPHLGRTVRLNMTLPAVADSIALPSSAIREGDRVFRVFDDRLESVVITRLGEFQNDAGQSHIIVRSDKLNDNDKIVVTQLTNAIDGMSVRISE